MTPSRPTVPVSGQGNSDPVVVLPDRKHAVRWRNADTGMTIVELFRDDFARLRQDAHVAGDDDLADKLGLIVAWFDGEAA